MVEEGEDRGFGAVRTLDGEPLPTSSQVAAQTTLENIATLEGVKFGSWAIKGAPGNKLVMTKKGTRNRGLVITCTMDLNVPYGETPQGVSEKSL